MLEELTIRNFALIDEVSVAFEPGFNVLSGETGAGKSILIDALSLALGAKGSSESVRDGADEAEVTAFLHVASSLELTEWSGKYGIEPEDGGLLIRRTLKRNGRGGCWVQAMPVTRAALGEISQVLVDIHGQHEHQSLFRTASHRKFLDLFAGIAERVDAFSSEFAHLSACNRRLEELETAESRDARETDYLSFAVEELNAAELKDGEEEELSEIQRRLAGSEELASNMERALGSVSEARGGALAQLRTVKGNLEAAVEIDPSLGSVLKRFEDAFFEMEDIADDLRRLRDQVEFDPEELERLDSRLARIGALEKKYSVSSIRELLAFARDAAGQLAGFEDRGEERRKLLAGKDEMQARLIAEAASISESRSRASLGLKEKIEHHLKALGMGDAQFQVALDGRKNAEGRSVIGPYGSDEVEFLLSANRGEGSKPLKSVASGGELSRVMLALKTVLSESDIVETMIFDEVDTGIGGEVARSVGEHLQQLSSRKQVFCITHLASIAVFADNHLQVSKGMQDGRTVARVCRVEGDRRVGEVARMLAGDRDAAASLEHAAEMLAQCRRTGGAVGV